MLGKKKDDEGTVMAETKKYGDPWDTATIAVTNDIKGDQIVRIDLDLPGDPKDKVIVETSIARAAKNMVDNIAGWLLSAAKNKD
jgi:hypothetical protein